MDEHAMTESYFVRVRGRTLGPYDLDAIRQMVRRAQVGRSHDVSHDGASWMPASTFPEIFERAQGVPQNIDVGRLAEPAGSPPAPDAHLSTGAPAVDPVPGGGRNVLWHYTMGGQQQATPVDKQTLVSLVASGRVGANDNVWNETMTDWIPVAYAPELAAFAIPAAAPAPFIPQQRTFPVPAQPPQQAPADASASSHYRRFVDKRLPAGILAIFLGALGIHKFMLGLTTGGLTMLLLFLLIVPIPALSVIGLVEGIIYLSKSEEHFFQDYAVKQKQWF
jgi:TM2 domain-containing membrane protein YozV